MRLATVLSLVLGLALASRSYADDPVTLKWRLKEGDTFYAKNATDMDMTMTVLDKDVEVKMKITGVQRFKILSVKPGATRVEMTILGMKMEAAGLPGAGLGDIGDRVKGATITATLNDELAVTKVEGYEKFLDKLAGDDDAVRKQMKGQFSESAVAQMISQVLAFAPKKPVKVGDVWNRTDKVPTGGLGDATVKQKYKLEAVNGDVAKIGLDGDLTFKEGDGKIPGLPEGIKVSKFDMKADKYKGTILFDTKLGRMKESKLDMGMKGSITMSLNGMDFEMKMKINAVQKTTVTDQNPLRD